LKILRATEVRAHGIASPRKTCLISGYNQPRAAMPKQNRKNYVLSNLIAKGKIGHFPPLMAKMDLHCERNFLIYSLDPSCM
jgi:hypothetical protein